MKLVDRMVPACALASLALLLGGCASRTGYPRVEGSVRLKEYITDPAGAATDSLMLDAASGVPVWLALDSLHFTFAGTRRGLFSVEAVPGDHLLLAGPTIWTADTLGAVHLAHGTVTLDSAIVLGNTGSLRVSANTTGAATRGIHMEIASAGRAVLAIRTLDGRIVRVLADLTWSAGTHALLWNGADDSGTGVPAGTYWVTLENYPDGAATAVQHVRGAGPTGSRDGPVEGDRGASSPRRGERALLHWP